MNALEWARAHRRSMLFLLALMVAGGLASALILPVALFPQVDFPRIRVDVEAGDRPADRMVVEVTKPVEEAVRAVPGVVKSSFDHQPRKRRAFDPIRLGSGHGSEDFWKSNLR